VDVSTDLDEVFGGKVYKKEKKDIKFD